MSEIHDRPKLRWFTRYAVSGSNITAIRTLQEQIIVWNAHPLNIIRKEWIDVPDVGEMDEPK